MSVRRVVYFSILALILVAAAMHMVHLRADFPNSTPWGDEVGKITDEGWWANGAVRAHLQGSWNVPGDYSPAPSDPVWPALLWCLFCFTGVSLQAARGLAVAAYFCSLWMTFLLLRKRMPIWAACLALALLVTSPYLYCFTRLALLEPLLTTLTLAGISLALRLPKYRHPVAVSVVVGLICALLMLTKPTAAFLFPAIAAAVLQPLWGQRKLALRCAATVVATFAAAFGLWIGMLAAKGLMPNYLYIFSINKYPKDEIFWPLVAALKMFYVLLPLDWILVPLGLILLAVALLGWRSSGMRSPWYQEGFPACVLVILGYMGFSIYVSASAPRYYPVLFFFLPIVVVWTASEWLRQGGWLRYAARGILAALVVAVIVNAAQMTGYALHPRFAYVQAAEDLTHYIDSHPNGNRILVAGNGDYISLATQLPSLCDNYGLQEYSAKMATYQPGWYAVVDVLQMAQLQQVHKNFTLEQVASYTILDGRMMYLFKMHPLDAAVRRAVAGLPADRTYPQDSIQIPVTNLQSGHTERLRFHLWHTVLNRMRVRL